MQLPAGPQWRESYGAECWCQRETRRQCRPLSPAATPHRQKDGPPCCPSVTERSSKGRGRAFVPPACWQRSSRYGEHGTERHVTCSWVPLTCQSPGSGFWGLWLPGNHYGSFWKSKIAGVPSLAVLDSFLKRLPSLLVQLLTWSITGLYVVGIFHSSKQ